MSSLRRSIGAEVPIRRAMMASPPESSVRSARLSSVRRLDWVARRASSDMRSGSNGFSRKSKAPSCIASTAIGTSPCPVIMITGRAPSWLISRRRSDMPSMPGILMSEMTMPG